MPKALHKTGGMAVSFIQGHLHEGAGWPPLAPATVAYRGQGKPLRDKGGLISSITYAVKGGDTVAVGTNKPYAAIQNNGGVIRAKKEWLWIPGPNIREGKTFAKRYGFGIADILSGLKKDGYKVFRKGRTVWCRSKRTRGGEYDFTLLYYLKKSVEIPARPFFYLTGEEIEQIKETIGDDLF
jgi:phage gpG-like protein